MADLEEIEEFAKTRGGGRSGPRTTRVKNKAPAPIQLTAEQILREAMERTEPEFKPPKVQISDPEELEEYRVRKRKGYEDQIRKNRMNISVWLKYGAWEESQKELERCRSVYERALDVDYRNQQLWMRYAEMEMRNKNVNAARNVWDRAVTLLPRVNAFWLKYSYMEDILGNYPGARQVYERWMEWEPDKHAWYTYIKFELRCGEIERARELYKRFVSIHPSVNSWIKWARFEEQFSPATERVNNARAVYEEAVQFFGEENPNEKLFLNFAKFEEKCKEVERARAIYKYALDHIPKKDAQELYKMWTSFEKKNGEVEGIEDVIVGKRRFQYEESLKSNPTNYDIWFDYAKLEETYSGDVEKIRDVYERAIAKIPPATEKKYWKRYIYLWINYALFDELDAQDAAHCREVYKACIKTIPHKQFSFSKIWIMYANFELRQKNLDGARAIYGNAIGLAPKDKIFDAYIQLELQLANVDRVRKIYEKWLEVAPHNCNAWVKFAHLERDLVEIERARAILELAISQPLLDMPEILWKAYIDFEIEQEDYDRTRSLYKRLLDRTKHVKVWISFAQFEVSIQNAEEARKIYSNAYDTLKASGAKEECVVLVESWKEFEQAQGNSEGVAAVAKKMPERIIKKRPIRLEDGTEAGFEEYYDYVFASDATAQPNLKILQRAREWKKQKGDDN